MRIRTFIEIEAEAEMADGSFDIQFVAPARRETRMADFAFDPFAETSGRIQIGAAEASAPRKRIPGQVYH
jgi:hypothetical protein